jgi:hypothetical protein
MSADVKLTFDEFFHAALVGVTRQIDNLRNRRVNRYGATDDEAWRLHIEGAAGEMAVAKYIGKFWSGNLGNLRAADVGDHLQVRTRAGGYTSLILHPSDPDDDIFVLVMGRAPSFCLQGWLRGGQGKHQSYWRDPAGGRPAFFVPLDVLEPIATLKAALGS